MDELIDTYIDATYTDELAAQLRRAMGILDTFEVPYQELVLSALSVSNIELPETTQDNVYGILNIELDSILSLHGITLIRDATLQQRCDFLEIPIFLENTDHREAILITLESEQEPIDKFLSIVEDSSSMAKEFAAALVQNIEPWFISNLKSYLSDQENTAELDKITHINTTKEEHAGCIANIRFFAEFLKTHNEEPALGIQLVDAGAQIGMPLSFYLPFLNKRMQENHPDAKAIAIDFLSLIYLSKTDSENPYQAFTTWSRSLFHDTATIAGIDKEFIRTLGEYNGYLGAQRDQNRIL